MQYTVRSDDSVSYTLCEDDEIRAILQDLHLLITTPEGSIPMYRSFGINMDFVDKPITVMKTLMISRVREKIEEFVPRAEFVGLTLIADPNTPGKVITILEVNI